MTCLLMVSVWKSLALSVYILIYVMAFEFWFEYLQLLIFSVAYVHVPLSFKTLAVYWITVNCTKQSKLGEISDETTSFLPCCPGGNWLEPQRLLKAIHYSSVSSVSFTSVTV